MSTVHCLIHGVERSSTGLKWSVPAAFAATSREDGGSLDGPALSISAQDDPHASTQRGVTRPKLRVLLAMGVGETTLRASVARARGAVGGIADEEPFDTATDSNGPFQPPSPLLLPPRLPDLRDIGPRDGVSGD